MLSQRFTNKQIPLPLGKTVCEICPHAPRRCEGPITIESYTMRDASVTGCHSIERIMESHKDIHGTLLSPQQSLQANISLPLFIPVIKPTLPKAPNFRRDILFGVTLSTLLKKSGDLRYETPESLRSALSLQPDAHLALIGTAQDFYLERFWKISTKVGIWQRLAALNFDFATSTTFSVWDKHPRYDQIDNQKRNFLSHDLMARCGVPSIPFLFFYSHSELDYREVINWLEIRSDVNMVAILAQFYTSREEFKLLLSYIRAISKDAPRPLKFLVVGPALNYKIDALLSEFNATVVTDQPIFKAIKGSKTLPNLSHRSGTGIPREILAVENCDQYFQYCERAKLQAAA
jgi:hypothetical protein